MHPSKCKCNNIGSLLMLNSDNQTIQTPLNKINKTKVPINEPTIKTHNQHHPDPKELSINFYKLGIKRPSSLTRIQTHNIVTEDKG